MATTKNTINVKRLGRKERISLFEELFKTFEYDDCDDDKMEFHDAQLEAIVKLVRTLMQTEQIELIIQLYEELENEYCQDEVTAWIVEDQSWMQAEKLKELLKERWRE